MSALRLPGPDGRVRLVVEPDPWMTLTPWQRRCCEAVLARRGNRTYAAHDLGVPVNRVQSAVREALAKGLVLPAGARRGPDRGRRPQRPNRYVVALDTRGREAIDALERHGGDWYAAADDYGVPMPSFANIVAQARRRGA